MSDDSRAETAARIRRVMDAEGEAVAANTQVFNRGRYEAIADIGADRHDALRERARKTKEAAIEHLPDLVEQLTERVEANGGTVYLADDAADATTYIQEVCAAVDARTVVKSKSMTSEEIDVNDALEAAGVEPVETDLGEFVIQLAGESPSHIVGPGIHKSREEIAALFTERFDLDEPLETAEELTAFARDYLGARIEEATVGMTGANFLVAETGSMALVTNEGNARKVVEATDVHVAVAGVEKVVPTTADLEPFLELLARSGTGQSLTSYTTLLTPPIDTPPVEADERAFHLVLVDNGRMAMREDAVLRETLYCVRCSACLNSCANFQHVGGHAFGGETYTGGIATGWETGVHGTESAAGFNDLCTGCTRCVNQCPVKIDVPWINTAIRDRLNRGDDPGAFDHVYAGLLPDAEPTGLDAQKRFFGNFETVARLGSATAPISNWLARSAPGRWLAESLFGIDRRRAPPRFRRETLRKWFASREDSGPTEPDRRAVLYPDLYTNHVDPERGKAAVRTLEALGVAVEVPAVRASGRAPLSQGMIDTARGHATDVADDLEPYLKSGYDVVVIEPSDLAMFRSDYRRLLTEDRFERLAEHSYEVLEYVFGLLENGADVEALGGPDDRPDGRSEAGQVFYHSHCQQRTLGLEAHTVAVLERAGYDVTTSDVECCGMAGSFGYKRQYYELSVDVGEALTEQCGEAPGEPVASGTSCRDQFDALVGTRPRHPIELLAPGSARTG